MGFADTALWRAALATEARHGRLRCYWLEACGEPIAHQVGVVYGNTYFLEATSFLPEYRDLSPGQVLLTRVIEDLCHAGLHSVDYGFGDAGYKRIYGTLSWCEATIALYGARRRARVAYLLHRATDAAAHTLQQVARRFGVWAAIKNRWRRHLAGETNPSN